MTEFTKSNVTETAATNRDATKDAGRVRFGDGMIRFGDATTNRDATKDAGRVRFGDGMIRF